VVKSSGDAISKEYFLYFQMASVGETDKHVMFSSTALVGRVFNLQVTLFCFVATRVHDIHTTFRVENSLMANCYKKNLLCCSATGMGEIAISSSPLSSIEEKVIS
jgi:hypothetical protein